MSHHHPGNLTLPTISSQVASTGLPDCPGARMSFTLGQAKGPCFFATTVCIYVCVCMYMYVNVCILYVYKCMYVYVYVCICM